MSLSLRDLFYFGEVTIKVGLDTDGLPYHRWKDTRSPVDKMKFEVEFI